MDVDGLVGPAPGLVPHLGEQLLLGDDLAGAAGEVGQQVELARRQVEHLARRARHGGTRGRCSGSPTTTLRSAGRPLPDPAQHRTDPRLELGGRVRLDDVVVGPRVQRLHQARVVVAGAGDDHRHLAHRPQHRQHLGAVDVGEPEVEDDHVGAGVDGEREPGHPVGRGVDGVLAARAASGRPAT